MNMKSCPAWNAAIAASDVSSVSGWQTTYPNPADKKFSPQDNKTVMIEVHEAGVGEDRLPQIIHSMLGSFCPDWCNRVYIFIVGNKLPERSNPQLQVMNEFAVELHEPDELGYITYQLRMRPSSDKLMFGLRRAISLGAHVISNKLEPFGKDEALLQT
jgi:hypothetical protein